MLLLTEGDTFTVETKGLTGGRQSSITALVVGSVYSPITVTSRSDLAE